MNSIDDLRKIPGVMSVEPGEPSTLIVIINGPIDTLPEEIDGCKLIVKEFKSELHPDREKRDYGPYSEWRGYPDRDTPGQPPTEFDKHEGRLSNKYSINIDPDPEGYEIVDTEVHIKNMADYWPSIINTVFIDKLKTHPDLMDDIGYTVNSVHDDINYAKELYDGGRYQDAYEQARDTLDVFQGMLITYVDTNQDNQYILSTIDINYKQEFQKILSFLVGFQAYLGKMADHFRAISGKLSNIAKVNLDTDYSKSYRDSIEDAIKSIIDKTDLRDAKLSAITNIKSRNLLKQNDINDLDQLINSTSSLQELNNLLYRSLSSLQQKVKQLGIFIT